MSRLTADCRAMSRMVSANISSCISNVVMLVGAIVFMFTLSWRLTLITFIVIPLLGLITQAYGSYYDVG